MTWQGRFSIDPFVYKSLAIFLVKQFPFRQYFEKALYKGLNRIFKADPTQKTPAKKEQYARQIFHVSE